MKNHEIVGNLQWCPVNWCMSSIFFYIICLLMSIPSLTHCSQCLLCIMRKREGPAAFTRLCSACPIQYPHRSLTFPHFVRLSLKLHRRVRPTAGRRRTKCLWSLPCVKYDSPHCQWLSFCQMKGVVCASCPPTGLSERLKGSSLEGGKGRCISLLKLTNSSSSTTAPSLKRGHTRR